MLGCRAAGTCLAPFSAAICSLTCRACSAMEMIIALHARWIAPPGMNFAPTLSTHLCFCRPAHGTFFSQPCCVACSHLQHATYCTWATPSHQLTNIGGFTGLLAVPLHQPPKQHQCSFKPGPCGCCIAHMDRRCDIVFASTAAGTGWVRRALHARSPGLLSGSIQIKSCAFSFRRRQPLAVLAGFCAYVM